MTFKVALQLLLFSSLFSPGHTTPGEPFTYVFEKGQNKFRNDFLSLTGDKLKVFCDQTIFFINNYNKRWDIMDQLVLDRSLCDYLYKNHPNTGPPNIVARVPTILIDGILPFGLNAVNRTELLLSLNWEDFVRHCYLTEVYTTHYMLEYGSWEQLILDFSVCLHNRKYYQLLKYSNLTTLDTTLSEFIQKLKPNDTSLQNVTYDGPTYLNNEYISRKEIETYDDFELNQFCNRILWLFDNYVHNWGIEKLVEIDVLACYLHVLSRSNFTRQETTISTKSPNIMVKGEVLYNKKVSIWRSGQLLSMSPSQLSLHCNKTSIMLMEYKEVWETFEEMSWDANFCNVQMPKLKFLFEETQTGGLAHLPEKIKSDSIEKNIKTCGVIGVLLKENWRLGHEKDEILVSLRSCMWTINPYVLCINKNDSTSEQTDSQYLAPSRNYDFQLISNWNTLTTFTAAKVYDICLQTIARIHYLYTNTDESQRLFKAMQMCLYIFKDRSSKNNNDENYTRGFYLTNDKIVSMKRDTPLCKDSLAVTLDIIFPESKIGDMYLERNLNGSKSILNKFSHSWETKRKDTIYFTKYCNNVTLEKPKLFTKAKLCSDLLVMQDNSSLSNFCSDAIQSINNPHDTKQLLLKINNFQTCLRVIICPRFNCETIDFTKVSMKNNNSECSRLLDDIIHKNFKPQKKDYAMLQYITTSIQKCQGNETRLNNTYSFDGKLNQKNPVNFNNISYRQDSKVEMSATSNEIFTTSTEKLFTVIDYSKPTKTSINVLSLMEEIREEQTAKDISRENTKSLEPLAILGVAAGILASLGSLAGSVAAVAPTLGGSIATTLSSVALSNVNSNSNSLSQKKSRSRKNKKKKENNSAEHNSHENEDSTEYDSDESSEQTTTTTKTTTTSATTTAKTSAITTPFTTFSTTRATTVTTTQYRTSTEPSTTTEEWSTTTPQPDVCWLEAMIPQPKTKKRRHSRSPPNRFLPESEYPHFPLGLCRLNINELNSYHDQKTSYEFIELKRECNEGGRRVAVPKVHLQKYMTVIINGETQEIIFSALLTNAKSIKSGEDIFVTIGPPDRDDVSLAFNDDNIQYSSINTADVIPNGQKVANMLLLLYIPKSRLIKFLQATPGKGKKINELEKEILKSHKQECLVYCAAAYRDKCGLFEEICPELKHRKIDYMLRDWQEGDNQEFEDLSLSRCVSHIYPMDVWGFKLSPPTPSKPNQCKEGVRFALSENEDVLPLRDSGGYDDLQSNDPFPHCSATVTERKVKDLQYEEFRRGIKRKRDDVIRTCMEGDLTNSRLTGYLSTMQEFDSMIDDRKQKSGYWIEGRCRPAIREHLQAHMKDKVDVDVCDNVQIGWWLDLSIPASDENESNTRKLSCFICKEFYKSNSAFKPDIQRKTRLMTEEGYLDESERAKQINTNNLYTHAKSLVHLDAVDYIHDKLLGSKIEKMNLAMRTQVPPRERLTRPMENLFYQVMFGVVHGYPSTHFKDELKFNQKFYYSEYGNKHQTFEGYHKIVQSVAEDYYMELLKQIKLQHPFSVVLDTYRDLSGRSMIAVSLMMMYKAKLQMKYFCLIELTSDHTAMAQFVAILDYIIEAPVDIQKDFFRGVVYFVGDGAAVNNGRHNSILTRFKEATGRDIQFFHCTSHKLHLVFTKILKNAQFLHVGELVRSVDDIHGFFDTRSNRLPKLLEKQRSKGRRPLSPHKPHPVRWASSMRQGFTKIYSIYEYIIEVVQDTIADIKGTPEKTRVRAQRLYDMMATKDYVLWIAFLTDVLDIFAGFSQYTQEKTGSLIDQVEMQIKLRAEIRKLSTTDGETMTRMVHDIKCSERFESMEVTGVCTLMKFEVHGTHFKNIKLDGIGTNLEQTKLSKLRKAYTNMVLGEIDLQFKPKYDMYAVLNPKYFPIPEDVSAQFSEEASFDPPESFQYAEEEFSKIVVDIAKPYSEDLYEEWRKLIWNIVINANFAQLREMKPSDFWIAMIERSYLPWTGRLIWIIKACLVIPTSSAEIERIFSSVTYLLGRYRVSTSVKTLNDYIRLRSELPVPLTDWQAYPYVVKFVNKGFVLSSETEISDNQQTTKSNADSTDEIDEEDVIICNDEDECIFDYGSLVEGNHR